MLELRTPQIPKLVDIYEVLMFFYAWILHEKYIVGGYL